MTASLPEGCLSISQDDKSPEKPARILLDLTLRTRQVLHLEYLAEREDTTLSGALAIVLDEAKGSAADQSPTRKSIKIRKHFSLRPEHVEFLDRLASKFGLLRSDMGRRLIDQAVAKDRSI